MVLLRKLAMENNLFLSHLLPASSGDLFRIRKEVKPDQTTMFNTPNSSRMLQSWRALRSFVRREWITFFFHDRWKGSDCFIIRD